MAKKEITRVTRIWTQTFVSGIVTMTLYLLIFGNILGKHIGTISGYSYMQFIIPGLIMMQVITASYSNAASSIFGQKFNRSIEEILVSPTKPISIIIGFCLGSLFRAALLCVGLLIVCNLITHISITHPLLMIITVILCSLLMSLTGLLNGLFANHFDQLNMVTSFILTPLIYLGGVFYNIATLPPLWKELSFFNPITYMVDLFRYAVLGYHIPHLSLCYLAILFLNIVLLGINMYCLHKGIKIKK